MTPQRRKDERGMASTVLILAVPALVAVALLLIAMFGDAVTKRTQTSTAADAAALAAAEQWRSYVDDLLDGAGGLPPDRTLDRLRPLLTTNATALDAGTVQHRARQLAAANDAELLSLNVRLTGRGLEFAVRTRSLQPAHQTSTRLESTATAEVEVRGGVCFRGSRLGIVQPYGCAGWDDIEEILDPPPGPEPDEEDDEPSPSPTPTPRISLRPLRADVRLAA